MQQNQCPAVSVIIPTFNRRDVLIKALHALSSQTLPPSKYEIVVADDGSDDGTEASVQSFAQSCPVKLTYTRDRNRGANAARNRAIARSHGNILLIINDDTIAIPEFVEYHLNAHRAHPDETVAVLGRMTISPEVPYSLFADLHLDAAYRQFEGKRDLDWTAFFTCNVSLKAAFLLRCGQFDERLRWHEDIELGERLDRHGLRVLYEPRALGYHLHFLTENDYLGIARREGIALADWFAKDPALVPKLAQLGLHRLAPAHKRVVYRIADQVFHPWLEPGFLSIARAIGRTRPRLAQRLYAKIFQARKRRAAHVRLGELGVAAGANPFERVTR